ncbi:MAG: TRAP transporter small permease [Ectothiorhodospiraceae bacterium]|nr:TRAP transporter small permease [Ectothiorhodospiraceae bacterium]MCH8506093.1 TRAP transporter small permease [Ectothiorhodospiraceae bacterium]
MRHLLDRLYQLCGLLAAASLLAICLLVLGQIVGRFFGITIPSANEMSGYFVLASTFLALAPTFHFGGHIRVKLVIERLPALIQRGCEFTSLILAIALTAFGTWWCVALVQESLEFGDVSPGRLAIPVAIPQSAMTLGLGVLLICLLDSLVTLIRGRPLPYDRPGGLMEE